MAEASLPVMIGRRMKARRVMLDMRQDELAGLTGIPQAILVGMSGAPFRRSILRASWRLPRPST